MEDGYKLGQLPECVDDLIIRDLDLIQGTWKETKKDKATILEILKRLQVSAIKRRLVVDAESLFEIRRTWPINSLKAEDILKRDTCDTGTSEGVEVEAATEASTEPSSPQKENRQGEPLTKWVQKQHLPMKRSVEGEVTANCDEPAEFDDPETGRWLCTAKIQDQVLYQKRYSARLKVTMYETRALVNRRAEDNEGSNECTIAEPLQYFQWVIHDHKDDTVLKTHFYLVRV